MEGGSGGKERSLRSEGVGAIAWRQGRRRRKTVPEDGGRFLGEAHRRKVRPFFFFVVLFSSILSAGYLFESVIVSCDCKKAFIKKPTTRLCSLLAPAHPSKKLIMQIFQRPRKYYFSGYGDFLLILVHLWRINISDFVIIENIQDSMEENGKASFLYYLN